VTITSETVYLDQSECRKINSDLEIYTKVLIVMTIVLIVMTIVLVVMTIVLIVMTIVLVVMTIVLIVMTIVMTIVLIVTTIVLIVMTIVLIVIVCEQAHWEKGDPTRNHAFYSIIPFSHLLNANQSSSTAINKLSTVKLTQAVCTKNIKMYI
jgi:energy-coupling factor transporter transmembrane protein EcfT